MPEFDPNAASYPGSGAYGLPHAEADARYVLIPVPFDATTSYRRGTADGPEAIREASRQVDLYDREVGDAWSDGIFMREADAQIRAWNAEARAAADPIIAVGGLIEDDAALLAALARVNDVGAALNEHVAGACRAALDAGKVPVVVGGDHATPFGAIQAYAERYPGMGVLHVDAHADLRDAYEGFTWSHASIMHNVMARIPGVSRLVQVGIRDFGADELAQIRGSGGRIRTFFDADLARRRFEGETWRAVVAEIVETLPQQVYVSFDIDGLDPRFCPNTGTPVPGGLDLHEVSYLLGAVVRSGRQIVGFDLNEVAPGDGDWDGNVGARLLYKMIGWSRLSLSAGGSSQG